jgi:hypothetical protein
LGTESGYWGCRSHNVADIDANWPHGSQDAIGQAAEFLVWASLITQSGGGLHIFLPLLDRGIDALVHRLEDGAYLALQVKGKTALHGTEAPITVYENHLFTADQLVIAVHLDGDRLGPFALVADASTFKRKAARIVDLGRVLLVADMPMRPTPGHKWSEDLVPIDSLAARLAAVRPAIAALPLEVATDEDQVIGFLGEQEVCRRLAMLDDCAVFRPFPDNEMAEILVRRLRSGATIGIQVKTGQLADPHGFRKILVNRSTFVGRPTTVLVALAWILPEHRFHESCLLIPSEALPSVADVVGPHYELRFRPSGGSKPSRIDRYRVPLESLTETLGRNLS